jgi:L,D-peptidoglycan transpeptidase YkuD (ErfK/YbiS/YcfS/YnhG family)
LQAVIRVTESGRLYFNDTQYRCTLGKNGLTADKREGDLKTPVGCFPLKECWYRADRLSAPETALPLRIIEHDDGWCDDPKSEFYNQHVKLPFDASHEALWREDHKYDIIVTLGYNDNPFVPGKGSAIFFHLADPDWKPTEGCVALTLHDMLEVLKNAHPGTLMNIHQKMPEIA